MPEPPPQYKDLEFLAPHAAGFLWCEGQLCCERGQWTGNPFFLGGGDPVAASRKWYNDRMKRVNNEGVPFFPPELEPHPADPGLPGPPPNRPRSPGRRGRRA